MQACQATYNAKILEHSNYNSVLEAQLQIIKDLNLNPSRFKSDKAEKSEKLPDPDPFDGTREKLIPFLFAIRSKLAINLNRYPTEDSKIDYVYSRLSGNAQAQILPRLQAELNKIDTCDQLLEHLERSFGDPDRRGTAQRIIGTLRMKNRPFAEYLAEFQRYIEDTGYNVEARKSLLEAGLFNELKDYLINMDVHNMTFESLIEKCHMIDGRHRAKQAQSRPRAFGTPPISGPKSPGVAGTNSATSRPLAANSGGDPMDLSVTNARKRGPLTPEEKQHRLINNLCLYCGGAGHQAVNCPSKPKTFVRSANLVSGGDSGAGSASATPTNNQTGLWATGSSSSGNA